MHDGAFGIAVVVVHGIRRFSWLIIVIIVLINANLQARRAGAKRYDRRAPVVDTGQSEDVGRTPITRFHRTESRNDVNDALFVLLR